MAYIRKRGSKWYYTIEIGSGETRKRKEVPGGSTRQEAEAAYARALVSLEVNGGYVEPTKKTVAEFFTEWLSDDVSINTHKNTSRSYRSIFENHIRPAIGDRKLRSIRPQMLQQILNDAKQSGLARSTVSSICAVLKKAFVYASDFCECIPKNPAQNIKVPKYTAPPKEIKTFTAEHLATIFRQFPAGHQFFLPLALSYHTGARLGECCALTWQDVDFDAREIAIQKTVIVAGGVELQDVPKTSYSRRIIPYGEKLYKILKAEKTRQAVARLQNPKAADAFICHTKQGRMLTPDAMRYFNQWCSETFGAGYTFHSMRHTHATLLLEAGEDLELVSKRLGHSSINTTAQTYSHVLDARKQKTRSLLDQVL